MNKLNITTIAAAIAISFSAGAMAQSLSKDDYKAAKDKITNEYTSAKTACSSGTGNAKDICIVEAKGRESVAKAELEARYKPSTKATNAVTIAKAEADYATAKEKCDDKVGNDKSACVKEAKTAETLAKAETKTPMPSSDVTAPVKGKSTVSTSKKESAGEYVEDAVITTKVKAAVLEEPSLKSVEINVETHRGIVQLSGFVTSQADIDKAVAISRNIKGATSVKNDMIVKGKQ
jgi:osmotically-inducible protein OsmY